jgi:DNA-binding SARP family transcriptional activator
VWGDAAPAPARGVIHGYVHRLRRVLAAGADGPVIVSSGGGYVLTAGGVSSDVQTFQREVAGAADARAAGDVDAAATRLAAAVERWQGPALAGLPGVFAEVERGRFVQVTGMPAAPIGISALGP